MFVNGAVPSRSALFLSDLSRYLFICLNVNQLSYLDVSTTGSKHGQLIYSYTQFVTRTHSIPRAK